MPRSCVGKCSRRWKSPFTATYASREAWNEAHATYVMITIACLWKPGGRGMEDASSIATGARATRRRGGGVAPGRARAEATTRSGGGTNRPRAEDGAPPADPRDARPSRRGTRAAREDDAGDARTPECFADACERARTRLRAVRRRGEWPRGSRTRDVTPRNRRRGFETDDAVSWSRARPRRSRSARLSAARGRPAQNGRSEVIISHLAHLPLGARACAAALGALGSRRSRATVSPHPFPPPAPPRASRARHGAEGARGRLGAPKTVLVAGAGIIGTSIAYHLAVNHGIGATLVDKVGPHCAASGEPAAFSPSTGATAPPRSPRARVVRDARRARRDARAGFLQEAHVRGRRPRPPTRRRRRGEPAPRTSQQEAPLARGVGGRELGLRVAPDGRRANDRAGTSRAAVRRDAPPRRSRRRREGHRRRRLLSRDPATGACVGLVIDGEVIRADAVVVAMGPWTAECWRAAESARRLCQLCRLCAAKSTTRCSCGPRPGAS